MHYDTTERAARRTVSAARTSASFLVVSSFSYFRFPFLPRPGCVLRPSRPLPLARPTFLPAAYAFSNALTAVECDRRNAACASRYVPPSIPSSLERTSERPVPPHSPAVRANACGLRRGYQCRGRGCDDHLLDEPPHPRTVPVVVEAATVIDINIKTDPDPDRRRLAGGYSARRVTLHTHRRAMPPERQYHASNGRAPAVVASRERVAMPGTPSRKERQRESSAVQDPGLKDYVRPLLCSSTCLSSQGVGATSGCRDAEC